MSNALRNVSVKVKLLILIGVTLAGFAIFGLYTQSTLRQLAIHGPYYKNVVAAKDVIADILPPPMYIVESYLIVLQMVEEKDALRLDAFEKNLARLEKEYKVRHDAWGAELPKDHKLRQVLLQDSWEPARAFQTLVRERFLAAVR
jgi:methyl-accepting chemotaxis protein